MHVVGILRIFHVFLLCGIVASGKCVVQTALIISSASSVLVLTFHGDTTHVVTSHSCKVTYVVQSGAFLLWCHVCISIDRGCNVGHVFVAGTVDAVTEIYPFVTPYCISRCICLVGLMLIAVILRCLITLVCALCCITNSTRSIEQSSSNSASKPDVNVCLWVEKVAELVVTNEQGITKNTCILLNSLTAYTMEAD